MRGTGYEAVVVHRKCPVTKQMHKIKLKELSNLNGLTKNHDKKQISMKINKRSADFMNNSGWMSRAKTVKNLLSRSDEKLQLFFSERPVR